MSSNATSITTWRWTTTPLSDMRHPSIKEIDWVIAVLLGIMTWLGVLFNCTMFYEFWVKLRGKVNVSFYIYFHLLGSDVILCVCSAPFSVFTHAMARSIRVESMIANDVMLHVYCNISGFCYNVVSKVTVQLILVLTFDRWLTIVYPRFHRNHVTITKYRRLIGTLWALSVLGSCSPFMAGSEYNFKHRYISLCSWDFTTAFGVRPIKERWLYLQLYIFYVILPIVVPLLLTIFFAVSVIVKLSVIRRRDYRRNRKTSRVSYAVNTVTFVTMFHIASYFIWHVVITMTLLGILSIIPVVPFNAAQNHIFTSYPIGAYLNATGNPIFLYFRILKRKLSFRNPPPPRSLKTIAIVSATATKQKALVCDEMEVVTFSKQQIPGRISTRVVDRVNSAKRIFRSFGRTLSVSKMSTVSESRKKVKVNVHDGSLVIRNFRKTFVVQKPLPAGSSLSVSFDNVNRITLPTIISSPLPERGSLKALPSSSSHSRQLSPGSGLAEHRYVVPEAQITSPNTQITPTIAKLSPVYHQRPCFVESVGRLSPSALRISRESDQVFVTDQIKPTPDVVERGVIVSSSCFVPDETVRHLEPDVPDETVRHLEPDVRIS